MRETIKAALSDQGNVSMMRVVTFLVVIDIMAVWTVTCLSKLSFEDFPWGTVAVLTTVVLGKAIQKFGEVG